MAKNRCELCGSEGKVYSVFGKKVCLACMQKRRTGKPGHSGMIYREKVTPDSFRDLFCFNKPLELIPVKKSHPLFVKWFMEHYPNSKGIVGRSVNFLIYRYGEPVGIIGFSSIPLGYKKFDEFFGFDTGIPENANKILNNNVFRLIKTERNLGTKVLKLARKKVREIYRKKYGTDLIGLVTFVEPPRTGAVYKADNWKYLGMTEGIRVLRRGKEWYKKQFTEGVKKHIFAYVY